MNVAWTLSAFLLAGDPGLQVWPERVDLTGPRSRQQLIATACDGGVVTSDLSAKVRWQSANTTVATVDDEGIVRPAADGTTTVTATIDGRTASSTIHVKAYQVAATPEFINDVLPVLTRVGCNSGSCHGALAGKGGLKLSLRGYDPEADHVTLVRQALGRRVDTSHPAESLVLQKPTRALPHGGGRKFDVVSEEYRRIHDWVRGGAPEPDPKAARVIGIEVLPAAARLRPSDKIQVLVRARYSDGRADDVTPWARFSSAGESTATVDEFGQVTVTGPGEAAINAMFGNHVAAMVVTVPRENRLDASVFSTTARHNFIDDHIMRKLQALGLPPAGLCDDRTWIRRAYLDAVGVLPTPAEVEAFVADASTDKRVRLVDTLLARSEYIDYWTYKWCDLFLLSSRKLAQPALWSFYRFIRTGVAENRGWDRLARDVLTASGSNLTHGAGNYFVMHQDPAERAEATAVTFLGTSLTCARCHNHPMEKWTQDQYWAFANLFGRVNLKSGERGGEIVVAELPAGDIAHLRRGVPQPPAPLDGAVVPNHADRRQALVDWLTQPNNPFFARALVNRVWRNFMGRGLVEAEDDFRNTNPPSHPELLDALTQDFVSHGYDVKRLIKLVMTSAAYQRASQPAAGAEGDDRYYSHYLVRRLSAEVIIDAYSQVTGIPTNFNEVYGSNKVPAKSDNYPVGTRALQLPDALVVSRFLDSFGRPAREQACACERQQESSMGQALHLNNGETLNQKLRAKTSITEKWVAEKVSDDEAIRRAFQLGLARAPSAAETSRFVKILSEYGADRRGALEDLCWAVFTSREFLFNH